MTLKLLRLLSVAWLACLPLESSIAQSRVSIAIEPSGHAGVEVQFDSASQSWSFRNAYAGVLGMAERIEEFRAFRDSAARNVRKIAAGEFRSDAPATKISYRVRLSEIRPSEMAHVSWVHGERGLLMFADLLPLEVQEVSAEFQLPSEWSVASSIEPRADKRYDVSEPDKAVFFVGNSLRTRSQSVRGMRLETVVAGAWRFKDGEALKAAQEVMKQYLVLTGLKLPRKSVILIAPLPAERSNSGEIRWKAETRGSTVVLLLDPNAAIKNWKGQLGVIFTHELLHLWVPNALNLKGDYDWFFEGFTLYIALRTALDLRIVNFREFLGTIARVYDSYCSAGEELSLIEASERRWTSHGSFVYDKGMLVAFLYDLMIRRESAGAATLADRYRDLFNGGVPDGAQGNEVIISVLGSSPTLKDFVKSYIENSSELQLSQTIRVYGLELDTEGKSSRLRVGGDIDASQRRLLRSLGYR